MSDPVISYGGNTSGKTEFELARMERDRRANEAAAARKGEEALDHWRGVAANCMGRSVPQISLGARDPAYKQFLTRCTPENIFGLIAAHQAAIEAINTLAEHLGSMGCVCQPAPAPGQPHHVACPVTIRAHPAFETFVDTATS